MTLLKENNFTPLQVTIIYRTTHPYLGSIRSTVYTYEVNEFYGYQTKYSELKKKCESSNGYASVEILISEKG